MAFNLTPNLKTLLSRTEKEPQLVLEIEGLTTILTSAPIAKIPRYGDPEIPLYGEDVSFVYGGLLAIDDQQSIISMQGTSQTISQQLSLDRGGFTSTSAVNIRLVDKGGYATRLITPGELITDILAVRAKLYFLVSGAAYPDDAILLMTGIIDEVSSGPGFVDLTLKSSEQLKRQQIFVKAQSDLASDITSGATSLSLESASNFIVPPSDTTAQCFVRINDEVIKYTGISSNTLTGLSRGQFGTTAAAHTAGDSVSSFYRLSGDAIDVSLKLMLSGAASPWVSNVYPASFVRQDSTTTIANAVFFNEPDIEYKYSLVAGDTVTITDAANASNNVSDAVISGFGQTDVGTSYIILTGVSLTEEIAINAACSFKSKYNTLPSGMGCGMTPDQVDIKEFEKVGTRFSSQISDVDIYLKDTIDANKLIDEHILFESGINSLPRKARASCSITAPPLSDEEIINLDETSVMHPDKIQIYRSTRKNFYNHVVWSYDEDALESDFNKTAIYQSADSIAQIKAGTQALRIQAKTLKSSADTTAHIQRASTRLLDRYQYGSESLNVSVPLKSGFVLEIGDAVNFGSNALKISDITEGSRDFSPRLFQVVDKQFNLKTGIIDVKLLNTAFGLDGRFGIISPSSYIDSGSTTTNLKLKQSFNTKSFEKENSKWSDFVGQKVKIHNDDFSFSEEVTLTGLSTVFSDGVVVSPALSLTPSADWLIDLPTYDDSSSAVQAIYKNIFVFQTPRLTVSSGSSGTVFSVSVSDAAKLFVGSYVKVHSVDFSVVSSETKVSSISGTTITVEDDLGFTPLSGYEVDLVGFLDGGLPYRLV